MLVQQRQDSSAANGFLNQKKDNSPVAPKKTNYGHLFTGGIAGAVSRTATSPLERLRILQQIASVEYHGKSIMGSFRHMANLEGFRGFFKGNGASVAKIAPFSALEFYFYALFKNQLFPNSTKLTNSEKLVAGCLTGGLA